MHHAELAAIVFVGILGLAIGLLFLHDLVPLVVNGLLIYIGLLRSFVEIKAGRNRAFVFGGCVAFALVFYFGTFFLLWNFTTFLVLTYIFAQLYWFVSTKLI